jgi:hypothetical protein
VLSEEGQKQKSEIKFDEELLSEYFRALKGMLLGLRKVKLDMPL